MKKYSFILCIALVAFVVASCGLKGNHTSLFWYNVNRQTNIPERSQCSWTLYNTYFLLFNTNTNKSAGF